MVNSNKLAISKTSKGKVSIYVEKGRIKARLPRQYFGGEQPRIALGMDATEANMNRAHRLAEWMTLDLQDGCFDESLAKYGITSDLKLKGNSASDQLPPKPELSLMEVWKKYSDYVKPRFKETTFDKAFLETYPNFLKSAMNATKCEDSIKIKNWLVENRSIEITRNLLSHLSKAYQLAIRHRLISFNPYDGMSEEITVKKDEGKTKDEVETDNDLLDKARAYTWKEAQLIIQAFQNHPRYSHYHDFVKFKFFTGCRTGEAIAFMWGDINWGKECIYFRRTHNERKRKYYNLKNAVGDKELIRIFPMPKDGELWNLLKSIPQKDLNENVFKSVKGKVMWASFFNRVWKYDHQAKRNGIILDLIEKGKLSKYLPSYNTRHTFITHQVFDIGIDGKIVSYWCGHGEVVSQKHYQDIANKASQTIPSYEETDNKQQSELDLLKKKLEEQQELINKLMQEKVK